VVSLNPAPACGLLDRGQVAPGRRGDLVRVRELNGVPVVREVWRGERRVA
jgi:alpha-D-ribose 1-methylphosphonate 5-triphosphate diphosphatase